ncbi:Innexin [Ancylostoma ceylanicum]|uniref:Innexin n=1 Tax=Ancylostoma ceylanicum TaxID=53326 RepID=A0A0D6M8S0_9BILA|nr:Innexin [Ancylostoma ceylanicum]
MLWRMQTDLIPHRLDDRERRQIGYYQWVPFVLAVAALMFHIPSSVWRMLSSQSGLNAALVLQLACQEQNVDPLVRNKTIDVLARHIDDALMYQREHGARKKNIYIFAVVRVGEQICFNYGICLYGDTANKQIWLAIASGIVDVMSEGREWRDSGKFPRVTLCDFEIRVLGNVHRHTVQCVLVVNMLTEKIFIFLWIWLSVLGLITALNLLFWLCALASAHCRQNFVAKHLDMESDQIGRFTDRFLRPDGVFLLQMIASHAGNLTCAKVTEALWLIFLRRSGKPVLDEKVESSDRGEWESNDDAARKESLPRRESWHEPPLPPPMPQLPIRSHYV